MEVGVEMLATEKPKTKLEIFRRGTAQISKRLPRDWTVTLIETAINWDGDGTIEINSASSERAVVVVEARLNIEGRDIEALIRNLGQRAFDYPRPSRLVMAPYLSPPVRRRLKDANLSYIDMTGNVFIKLSRPGLYISDRGAGSDPWRKPGRPRGTLRGGPAARVVRVLIDFHKTWTMRDLIKESGASTGATYRVIEYLELQGLAKRDASKRVRVDDWSRLLREWGSEYSLVDNNMATRWVSPRGIPSLLERMAKDQAHGKYAVTGTLAAAEWAPYSPPRLATAYVSNPDAAAETWGLSPTESGANVLLVEPKYSAVFERSWLNSKGVIMAAASQVYADLATGPGRNPSEAQELLAWMERNESAWRIQHE